MRFSFLDFYKINSTRKLKMLLDKCNYNYVIVRWFLDNCSLNNDDLKLFANNNSLINNSSLCFNNKKECYNSLDKFAKEEDFSDIDNLLGYSLNTCFLICISNILLLFIEWLILRFSLPSAYFSVCFLGFICFPLVTFFIIKDFYPILSLFRIMNRSSLKIKLCYLCSVHLNTLVLIFMLILSFQFLA